MPHKKKQSQHPKPIKKQKSGKAKGTQNPMSYPEAKITSITDEGIFVKTPWKKYFLSFAEYPWFRYAPDWAIHKVELLSSVGASTGRLCWPALGIDFLTETIEKLEGYTGPLNIQRIIAAPAVVGTLADRIRDPKNGKKEFSVCTQFAFVGCFSVTADSEEEARRIVEQQCAITCGGVHIDILKAPLDVVGWKFNGRPTKEIIEVTETDE